MRITTHQVLTWILTLVILASVVGLVNIALTSQEHTEQFTELYVLGPGGNADNYPTNLSVGETGRVVVGITNNEHNVTNYELVILLGNRTISERKLTIGTGRTWQDEFMITPESPGKKQLRILLYKGSTPDRSNEVYRRLKLRIRVVR